MMAKQLKTPADEEVELRESFKVSLFSIEREASERMKSVISRSGSRGVLGGGGGGRGLLGGSGLPRFG